MTALLAAEEGGGGSFLVSPSLGLMIWTLLAFGITLYLLNKLAFPRIAEALDRRRRAIEESIEAANQAKQEGDHLLEEYRARLREAREQAEDIVTRVRKAVADLTVTATEKITRKALTEEDHRRLIEEALSEVDFEELAPSEGGR